MTIIVINFDTDWWERDACSRVMDIFMRNAQIVFFIPSQVVISAEGV